MKKIIPIIGLLLAGCDDSGQQKSSTTNTSPNEKTVDFFLNNAKERKEAVENCFKMLSADEKNGKSWNLDSYPECQAATSAEIQIQTEARLESRISVKAFHDNHQAAIYFARLCNQGKEFTLLLPSHPTCEALFTMQKQLQQQCKGQEQNYQFQCSFNTQLTRELGINN